MVCHSGHLIYNKNSSENQIEVLNKRFMHPNSAIKCKPYMATIKPYISLVFVEFLRGGIWTNNERITRVQSLHHPYISTNPQTFCLNTFFVELYHILQSKRHNLLLKMTFWASQPFCRFFFFLVGSQEWNCHIRRSLSSEIELFKRNFRNKSQNQESTEIIQYISP